MQEQAPWQLAKDESQAAELDAVLFALAEGLRVVSVLLHPFMPGVGRRACWTRSAWRTARSSGAVFGAGPGGAVVGDLGQLFPGRAAAEAA